MVEQYVTLEEAAELEGIKYKTLAQKISRNKGCYMTKLERPESGGKNRIMVAVSSLSHNAKNAYKERDRLKETEEVLPDVVANENQVPWYVVVDLDWFIENHKERYYQAVELGNIVREFLQYNSTDKTQYAEIFAQKHLGKGKRTLYRYVKAYLEADAWAHKMTKERGGNYDFYRVLALCRKPKESGLFPSFTPEVKQIIKNIWFNEEFAKNQCTRELLYEKLQVIAEVNGWEKIPSYQSVTRYINYLMEDEGLRNAWLLASKGLREYRNKAMVKASRNTKGLQVMQIVMGDEHTFDCWVTYKHSNGTVTPIRPVLVAWIDMRSRKIIGDVLCYHANSDILKQSLLKMIYQDAGGVPQYIYIDNGKDYTSETMTGVKRKNRRKARTDLEKEVNQNFYFDDMTKGFYKSIGIVDDHEALPYQPWSKGQIERFFGGVCTRFSKRFTSYTGTLTGSKTSAKIPKDIKKMFEEGKLLSIEEFYKEWHQWLQENYHAKPHQTLKRIGEQWNTPDSLFENGERYEKAAPPKSYATMLMMKSENVPVTQVGIIRKGYEYRADELCDYIHKKVNIKYNPYDMAVLYVFDQNGKKICEAYSQELLDIAPQVTEKTLNHIKMQKRQEKRDKQRLKETQEPISKINDQYVGFDETVGGINLMIEGKANKQVRKKIISLPDDRTYTQNLGMRKQAERELICSEYMTKKAEEALKKLRIM